MQTSKKRRMAKTVRRQCLVNTLVARREQQAPSGATGDVSNLVANYAAVGLRHRRTRWSFMAAAAFMAPLAVVLAIFAWNQTDIFQADQRTMQDARMDDLSRLTRSLATEVQAITGQREAFQAQREMFQQQSNLLAEELAAVIEQRTEMEQQRLAFASQGRRMAAAIDDIDGRRVTIQNQQQEIDRQGPLIKKELAAMAAERDRLEARRLDYAEEGELLSQEITQINEQRRELARQRLQVERQRKEIQALLEQTREIQSRLTRPDNDGPVLAEEESASSAEKVVVAKSESRQSPEITALTAGLTTIEDGELATTRGGIDIGDGMIIDIGLTRSASINGVEQYSSTIRIDDVFGGGASADGGAAPASGVLLQSGPGNVVPVNLFDSSTGNFAIIQNSLDHQNIATQRVYDISIENVSSAIKGIATGQAIDESLMLRN